MCYVSNLLNESFLSVGMTGLEIPADDPTELLLRLKGGIGALALEFDVGLASVHVDLNLSFAGGWLSGVQISESFHQ